MCVGSCCTVAVRVWGTWHSPVRCTDGAHEVLGQCVRDSTPAGPGLGHDAASDLKVGGGAAVWGCGSAAACAGGLCARVESVLRSQGPSRHPLGLGAHTVDGELTALERGGGLCRGLDGRGDAVGEHHEPLVGPKEFRSLLHCEEMLFLSGKFHYREFEMG